MLPSTALLMSGGATAAPPSAEAAQYFARITDPGSARKAILAELIDDLVADGLWAKLDAAWLLASDIAGNARVNLKSSSYTLSENGGLTFTADQGYQGNGTTGYLSTGYTPSVNGSQFTQNSASMGGYVRNSRTTDQLWGLMGCDGNPTGNTSYLYPKVASVGAIYSLTGGFVATAVTNAQGMWISSRTSSTARALYRNGSSITTSSATATGRPNREVLILASMQDNGTPAGYSGDQVSFAFIGSGLTSAEQLLLTDRVMQYLSAIAGTLAQIAVFAGQSNSRGVFLTVGDVPGYLRSADSSIKIWSTGSGAFVTLDNGVNNVVDTTYGTGNWGAEAQFSYLWRQDNPSGTIYIIKTGLIGPLAADGSQNDWSPSTGEFFATMQAQVRAAKTALLAQGIGSKVTDFYWMQGEGDTVLGLTIAQAYQANLADLASNVRSQCGGLRTKMIVGRISQAAAWTDGAAVRTCQAAYVASDSRARLVDTDSYPMQGDAIHYTAAGQVSLGADMYAASKTIA